MNHLCLWAGLLLGLLAAAPASYATEYHVAATGRAASPGTAAAPLRTITQAAALAQPGDTITVHAGTYREWLDPPRGGESDTRRILYRAAPGERVYIKGSEVVTGWKRVQGNVWKVELPNTFFGRYNPYQDSIFGDWFYRRGRVHHTGEVFLNGRSLYEKASLDEVLHPVPFPASQTPSQSVWGWYCRATDRTTTIWANFQGQNPNRALVEISTRPTCIYPTRPGINFLTFRGFDISQAATQWAAPTAEQVGMVATHWNKGWIIEDNTIHDAKCAGITLGKDRSTGHNVWSADVGNVYNDGNIHYIETVFRALRHGWNRATVGGHVVRRNVIYNCEQAGLCGSMGAAFSIIEDNHIHHIWTKRQFDGAEIGGIKFHGAIDTQIRRNRLHDCGRAMWLDWMTQGTRISRNLCYRNTLEDLYIEVNHGPYVVDNNVLLSPVAVRNWSEGGAYVHNLLAGSVYVRNDLNRFTPYFLPHSTDVAGLTTIFGGDDRLYHNLVLEPTPRPTDANGLSAYTTARLPCWLRGNLYYQGASPSARDEAPLLAPAHNPNLQLLEQGTHVYLSFTPDSTFRAAALPLVATETLGLAKIPKLPFTAPNGAALRFDQDYTGAPRTPQNNKPGPFLPATPGRVTVQVW